MKGGTLNMSQVLFLFQWGGVEVVTGRAGDKGGFFYGTEERRVSQGDILDTSLNLALTVFHLQSSVPSMDEHACASDH